MATLDIYTGTYNGYTSIGLTQAAADKAAQKAYNKDYEAGKLAYDGTVPTFGGKYAANDTWAWITRQQWDDYEQRFAPRELELINQTTYNNPSIVGQEVQKGMTAATNAVDTTQAMNEQFRSRFGASIDPRAQIQSNRLTGLTKAAASVDAAARIRETLNDQNRQIALGLSQNGMKPVAS